MKAESGKRQAAETREKPPTLIGSLRWFLHRLIHRVPSEQHEIAKAHQRGLEKGWELVQNYLKTKSNLH